MENGETTRSFRPTSLRFFQNDGVTNVLDLIDVLLAFGQACP